MNTTLTGVAMLLAQWGVWRADIIEDRSLHLLKIEVPMGCKGRKAFEAAIPKYMPVSIAVQITEKKANWIKNRKKYTYNHAVILSGKIREIEIDGVLMS